MHSLSRWIFWRETSPAPFKRNYKNGCDVKNYIIYSWCFVHWPHSPFISPSCLCAMRVEGIYFGEQHDTWVSFSLWYAFTPNDVFTLDSYFSCNRVSLSLVWNSVLPDYGSEYSSMQWEGANEQQLVGWRLPVECPALHWVSEYGYSFDDDSHQNSHGKLIIPLNTIKDTLVLVLKACFSAHIFFSAKIRNWLNVW